MTTAPANREEPITVVIIEDNCLLREGWKATLESQSDLEVIGDFSSCEEAFKADPQPIGDVYLMDIELPGMSGIEGVSCVLERNPAALVIMTTMHDDDQSIFDALCAGAVGYLVKAVQIKDLIQAIHDAMAGGSPMTPNVARKVISHFHKPTPRKFNSLQKLTSQELTILEHMAEGQSYTTIAKTIFLSVHGVRYHLRHIYEKLQVNNRGEAVAEALKQHLIRPLQ